MTYRHRYDTEWLMSQIASGRRLSYLSFWGHTSRGPGVTKACLSQWWPSNFTTNGRVYHTAELWMMDKKAEMFGSNELRAKILSDSDPRKAKALGRAVKNFDQRTWDAAKFDLVVRGNYLKFSQNRSLEDFLVRTGEQVLVEASPVDRIWGVGLSADDPDILCPSKWRGANLLGYALMVVRDLLGEEDANLWKIDKTTF